MWQLTMVCLLLFIAIALAVVSLVNGGIDSWSRYSVGVVDSLDHRMSGLFLFTNTRKMVLCYLMLLMAIPSLVYLLSGSVPLVLMLWVVLWLSPKWVINRLESIRRKRITEALPDVLSQIAAAMKAGSTLTAAIESMIEESSGPVAQEFSLLLREQKLGMKLRDALDNLAERVQSEEMDLVVTAAMVAQDVGGNLSEIFQRLSGTLRRKLEMEGKIRALTAQGVLQGWVVGLLPFGVLAVVSLLEPDAVEPILSSLLGWVFLALILLLELVGGLLIRKIVTIDI